MVDKIAARKQHRDLQAAKRINDHIKRGHTCCLDKYGKDNLPANFVRCVDCRKPLDKVEEIC